MRETVDHCTGNPVPHNGVERRLGGRVSEPKASAAGRIHKQQQKFIFSVYAPGPCCDSVSFGIDVITPNLSGFTRKVWFIFNFR